jgi:hypothetical protein
VHRVARRRDGEEARRAALAGELERTGAGSDEHRIPRGGSGVDEHPWRFAGIAPVELGEPHGDAAEPAAPLPQREREAVALIAAGPRVRPGQRADEGDRDLGGRRCRGDEREAER